MAPMTSNVADNSLLSRIIPRMFRSRRIVSLLAILAVLLANSLCVCEIAAASAEPMHACCAKHQHENKDRSPLCHHCDVSAATTVAQPDAGFTPAMPLVAMLSPRSSDICLLTQPAVLLAPQGGPPPSASSLLALHCALIR